MPLEVHWGFWHLAVSKVSSRFLPGHARGSPYSNKRKGESLARADENRVVTGKQVAGESQSRPTQGPSMC